MKKLLLSTLLLPSFVSFGQGEPVQHVRIAKEASKQTNFFPHIENYYDGEIPIAYLGYPYSISIGKGCAIASFLIAYPSSPTPVLVKGNTIPDDIIYQISKQCLGQMIFITEIVAFDSDNNLINVKPMTLIPIK